MDQHTLKVSWKPPPKEHWNGEIQGYYVGRKLASAPPEERYNFVTAEFSHELGKEHQLKISDLKYIPISVFICFYFLTLYSIDVAFRMFTSYSVVVQAFNRVGAGPASEEVTQHTAEGTPEQPPQDVSCTSLTSQSVRVSWSSPPLASANGVIKGYKVVYGPSQLWFGMSISVLDNEIHFITDFLINIHRTSLQMRLARTPRSSPLAKRYCTACESTQTTACKC